MPLRREANAKKLLYRGAEGLVMRAGEAVKRGAIESVGKQLPLEPDKPPVSWHVTLIGKAIKLPDIPEEEQTFQAARVRRQLCLLYAQFPRHPILLASASPRPDPTCAAALVAAAC